ncbi:MAG: class I SAM-dependent methyltransferase, partial [Thermodesulfobacteriota bacterium]|nr:class I SAM-dependent methyltransferase [Thermodesulfobacteriota bacterium]
MDVESSLFLPSLLHVKRCDEIKIMELDKEKIEFGMIERIADLKGARVLEVGCGDGRLTLLLAGKSGELVAIDPDGARIAEARKNISGVDFRIGSGEALEFEDESFDLIIFTMSLHHHTDCVLALREARRALRKDGMLVVLEPAVDGETQRIYRLFKDETPAIERALGAINGSDFNLEQHETFYKNWVFEDKEELYSYHFENYSDTDYDSGIVDSMNELLGEKVNDKPIILRDKLEIFSMR